MTRMTMLLGLSAALVSGGAGARDQADPLSSEATHVSALAPFVGQWLAKGQLQEDIPGIATAGDAVVIPLRYAWTLDRQFLSITYSIRVNNTSLTRYQGMMGWDPITRQIKSWGFDSNGAQTSAYWTRIDNGWTAHVTGVYPSGKETTSLLRRIEEGPDTFTLQLSDPATGGQNGPDAWEMVFQRSPLKPTKPPAPRDQRRIKEQKAVNSTAFADPTSREQDLTEDLAKVQGKWERWEPSGFFKRRVTKEISGNSEKVTYYQISGEVDVAHTVDFQLARGPGPVRIFHCSNMTFVEGPDKGTKSSASFAYAYTVNDDSFVEIWGSLAGEENRPLRTIEWTRAKN